MDDRIRLRRYPPSLGCSMLGKPSSLGSSRHFQYRLNRAFDGLEFSRAKSMTFDVVNCLLPPRSGEGSSFCQLRSAPMISSGPRRPTPALDGAVQQVQHQTDVML